MSLMNVSTNYVSVLWIIIFLSYTLIVLLKKWQEKLNLLLTLFQYCLITVLFFLIVNWHSYSYYLRYLLLFICLVTSIIAYIRNRKLPLIIKDKKRKLSIFILVLLIILNAAAFGAYFCTQQPVELAFPFKDGTYYILNGGNSKTSLFMNYHSNFLITDTNMRGMGKDSAFAVDILKLNDFGTSCKGIMPEDLSQHEIFGETVYSPCEGTVVYANASYDDQMPTPQKLGLETNIICIKSGNVFVFLSHLKKDSIIVKKDDVVKAGQPLAQIGNSGMGNHNFPHLHINVQKGNILDGVGVPFVFDGSFPVRNKLFIINDDNE